MTFLIALIAYLKTHGVVIATILLSLVTLAEMIVRLTPTKKDDGAVQRIGGVIRKAIDMIDKLFPNIKKGGGKHPKLKDKEEGK